MSVEHVRAHGHEKTGEAGPHLLQPHSEASGGFVPGEHRLGAQLRDPLRLERRGARVTRSAIFRHDSPSPRRSMRRFALPTERSMAPGGCTSTAMLMPIYDFTWCASSRADLLRNSSAAAASPAHSTCTVSVSM